MLEAKFSPEHYKLNKFQLVRLLVALVINVAEDFAHAVRDFELQSLKI